MNHAGFWRRFGAALIDGIVVLVGLAVVGNGLEAAGVPFFETADYGAATGELEASVGFEIVLSETGTVIAVVLAWHYFALMESGRMRATLGKRALGLRVAGLDGGRIGFGRASARTFAKLLSVATLFAGFAMAGFTRRKQALHDLAAGCLVLAGTP